MDRAFFEQLAMPLFDQLYNHACWLTGDRADAEDLVQETYAKALKGFASFAEGTNLRAWMFRILRNAFLNSRSGLKQKTEYLEDDEAGVDEAVAHEVTPEALFLAQRKPGGDLQRTGAVAGGPSRDHPAVRCGRDVVSRDCAGAGCSDGNGDVAAGACTKKSACGVGCEGGGAMMACSQDRNVLAAYLDGELTADQERSLQEHLRTCPSARLKLRRKLGCGAR